jgi:hypothetical protein
MLSTLKDRFKFWENPLCVPTLGFNKKLVVSEPCRNVKTLGYKSYRKRLLRPVVAIEYVLATTRFGRGTFPVDRCVVKWVFPEEVRLQVGGLLKLGYGCLYTENRMVHGWA